MKCSAVMMIKQILLSPTCGLTRPQDSSSVSGNSNPRVSEDDEAESRRL